jgi:Rap1a immunity proteins
MTNMWHNLSLQLCSFLIFCSLASPVDAASTSAIDLFRKCKIALRVLDGEIQETKAVAIDAAYCAGFIDGVVQIQIGLVGVPDKPAALQSIGVCLPPAGASTEQLTRVTVKFMEGRPEELHRGASFVAALALALAFPCQ